MYTSVFDHGSYKSFLKALITAHGGERGYQAGLAKGARCSPSYLSRALATKIELTPDHAVALAEHLGLDQLESEFLLILVMHSRATTSALRARLSDKLAELKKRRSNLSQRLRAPSPGEIESYYYSSWYWSAIHVATAVPELQTVEAISARLGLPAARVRSVLERLAQDGFVEPRGGRWVFRGGGFHLPADSPMSELNHAHWRQRATLDVQRGGSRSLHYTHVFSLTRKDARVLREKLVKAIDEARALIGPSEPEELCCLSLGLFEV